MGDADDSGTKSSTPPARSSEPSDGRQFGGRQIVKKFDNFITMGYTIPNEQGVSSLKKNRVSSAVIRRLPRYHRYLSELKQAGVERISSGALGERMNLTASQIRQDLSCFGEFGQQGYGYNIETLLCEVADILGMNAGHSAILLGAGNLGRALLQNFQFARFGMRLAAAFDIRPDLVGTDIGGIPILHMDGLEGFLAKHRVSVGVLTVPGELAARAAERLAAGGVRGIWNFTNTEFPPPSGVVVEDVHFSDSLLALSYMISDMVD